MQSIDGGGPEGNGVIPVHLHIFISDDGRFWMSKRTYEVVRARDLDKADRTDFVALSHMFLVQPLGLEETPCAVPVSLLTRQPDDLGLGEDSLGELHVPQGGIGLYLDGRLHGVEVPVWRYRMMRISSH